MDQLVYLDELITEYLLFRGYVKTFTCFSSERVADKTNEGAADGLANQIIDSLHRLDLVELMDLWSALDSKLFTHLPPSSFAQPAGALLVGLKKAFLVKAAKSAQPAKVDEFFHRFASELIDAPLIWQPWFALQHIKEPQSHPMFALYFSKGWFNSLCVSLKNFLATAFDQIPLPKLLAFEVDRLERRQLALELRMARQEAAGLKRELANARGQVAGLTEAGYRVYGKQSPTHDLPSSSSPLPCPSSPSAVLLGHSQAITRVRFAGDGNKLATASQDGTIRLYDLKGLLPEAPSAPISPVLQPIAGAASSSSSSHSPPPSLSPPPPLLLAHSCSSSSSSSSSSIPLSLAWDPKSDSYLAYGTNEGRIRVFNSSTRKLAGDLEISKDYGNIMDLAVSPSDKWLICSAVSDRGLKNGQGAKGLLEQWDLSVGRRALSFSLDNPLCQINCFEFNHNGSLLLTGGSDGKIRLFDMGANKPIMSWPGHTAAVSSIKFSPDENSLISMGLDGAIVEFSIHKEGKVMRTFQWPADTKALKNSTNIRPELAFDSEARYFALSGSENDYDGWLYEMAASSPIQTISGHAGPISSIAWHPSLNLVATGSADHTARLTWIAGDGHGGGGAAETPAGSRRNSRTQVDSSGTTGVEPLDLSLSTDPKELSPSSALFTPDRPASNSNSNSKTFGGGFFSKRNR